MRLTAFAILLVLLSCGQKKSDQKGPAADTTTTPAKDTTKPMGPVVTGPSAAVREINGLLAEKFGGTMAVITDTDANWMKDEFEYFIAPKRKTDPDYPYLAKGDFNGDGQPDAAALVKTKDKPEYQLAIIFGSPLDKHRISFWKNNIDVCAISTYPKGELQGIDEPSVNMNGDGINVEYYEKASFVVYWDGKKFKKAQTGD